MKSRVVSLRVPAAVDAALARSTSDAGLSDSAGLDLLLRNSFDNCQLLFDLADCPDFLNSKLDVRIPLLTFERLQSATEQLKIPASVYIRKLLYHFYITKSLRYVQSDGHYTLAGRHV
ncbi:MAG TPA: hypothetical protein VGM18_10720 [Candidatus Sulfotelmatobacter sp.]|jgi:hypothetical protein